MSTIEFVAPGGGDDVEDGVRPADINGHLVICYPIEYAASVPTKFSTPEKPGKPAIRLNVADLTTGEFHGDVLWFGGYIVNDLKRTIGKPVLARIGQGTDNSKGNLPWILIDATTDAAAIQAATAWLNANPGRLSGQGLAAAAPAPAPQAAAVPAASMV